MGIKIFQTGDINNGVLETNGKLANDIEKSKLDSMKSTAELTMMIAGQNLKIDKAITELTNMMVMANTPK